MTRVEAKDLLDLRGDLPNPRRIDGSELNKLPRVETRTSDPHDPGREVKQCSHLAELRPELTDRVILLADTKDSQPLGPREGPFRIIVCGEKLPGAPVCQVKAMTVRRN